MRTLVIRHRRLLLLLLACLAVVAISSILKMSSHRLRYVGSRATLSATEQARRFSMPPRYPMTVGGWSVEGIYGAYQLQHRPSNRRWFNPRTGDAWAFKHDSDHHPVAISADGQLMLQMPTYPDSFVEGVIEHVTGRDRDPDNPPYRRSEIQVIKRPNTLVAKLPVVTRPDPYSWNIRWRGKDLDGDGVFLDTPHTIAIRQAGEWLIFRW